MFEDKRVLVTGGAGALGRSVVAYYEERGARIAILDYSDELLDAAFPEKNSVNLYLSCDLTDRDSAKDAVQKLSLIHI